MITRFLNLQSFNDGTTKSVSVDATEDVSGGMETFTFTIIDQTKQVSVNFASKQTQNVTVKHTAAGKGLVKVTAANSPKSLTLTLNVDKIPGDDGSGD
jgi:hypothetical protein